MDKPRCLIIGGGKGDTLPEGPFEYITFDIEAKRHPDVVGDAGKLPFGEEEFEGIYASHVLEHLSPRAYGNVLEEWYRVLKPGGEIWLRVPNLTLVAEWIMMGKTEETIYLSDLGPITPIDMLMGLSHPLDSMTHRWAFTRESLADRAKPMQWADGLVWEHRECSPYDRCELRLYGRKPGDHPWVGWETDKDLTKSGDAYAIKLGG